MNDYNLELLDRTVNKNEEITAQDRRDFKVLMQDLFRIDEHYKKEIESFLKRQITHEEAVALKLARIVGRNEKGLNQNLLSYSGNYTKDQILRKDKVLDLAGFGFNERIALVGHRYVEDILTRYSSENLLVDNTLKTPAEARNMNSEVIRLMNNEAYKVNAQSKRKQEISRSEAIRIYEAVTRHPVARVLKLTTYDPDGNIGFCFGRAMTTHLEALSRGIDKDSIRKVFVVGVMRALVGDKIWQFHVATAIKGDDGHWWVLDPFFGQVVHLEKWYEKMYSHDVKGVLRLYVTEPTRFGAAGSHSYQKSHLMLDSYNNYFKDLMEYYRKKSRGQLEIKPIWEKTFDWILSIAKLGV
ncbi:MAG: hypothetical protein ACK41T_10385 [Pseudobdellovibrio sp.]